MDEAHLWLRLSRTPGATIQIISQLIERFGSIQAVFSASSSELGKNLVASSPLLEAIQSDASNEQLDGDLEWLHTQNNHLIPFTDPCYPLLLKESSGSPVSLFVCGDVDVLSMPQLAIVGSRNPTHAGEENARAFAASLAKAGVVITSGMAKGIDAAAHSGAMAVGGKTIAVMGTGLKRVYPSAHRELAHLISEQGALVSEFALDAPPKRDHFPRRNRVIAGLSLGTLVVEAAIKSGSLITARLAADSGREVFALPGSIHSPLAKGCHRLIKQGAKLVETASDIAEELGPMVDVLKESVEQSSVSVSTQVSVLEPGFELLLKAMAYDPVDIDMLVERSGLTAEAISSMLLRMELDGLVETNPGGTYQRVGNALAH